VIFPVKRSDKVVLNLIPQAVRNVLQFYSINKEKERSQSC
jgi:hypothetical protein